jgi:uncharacterized radical SAM superfamily Fe-S cluster-containing enzyme
MNEPIARLVLGHTSSVCPVCLKTIPARRVGMGDTVYLEKACPEHGDFATPVWRGLKSYLAWGRTRNPPSPPLSPATTVDKGCPHDCGLCPDHLQQSCCVLLEVTSRCDLACPVCYAGAGPEGSDMRLDEIDAALDMLIARTGGRVHVQLSGGEPTVRDDLPEIVARVRARGIDFVQLNSNGVRLAREPGYTRRLAEAGLDCVFLQFDGVEDDVYRALRGRRLLALKRAAIMACADARLGVVLVPTVVAGVNDQAIGDIVDFALDHLPTVRAVHFQPASTFGRFPVRGASAERVTLPEVMTALVAWSGGTIRPSDFAPGSAENPYCSFSGRFRVGGDGRLKAEAAVPEATCCGSVTVPAREPEPATACCCGGPSREVERERRYVAGQWRAPSPDKGDDPAFAAFDQFLAARERTLSLSGMAFQDAWTLDLDRVRQCHIHVVSPDRRLIPFCAYNLTDTCGRGLYRPIPPGEDG